MLPPYNDKVCPYCQQRQLTDLQVDAGQYELGVCFFYCDTCLMIFTTEGVTEKKARLDVVQFTGLRSSIKTTIDFYENISLFYKTLVDYLDFASKERKLVMIDFHAATILRHEAWEMFRECEVRLEKLRNIGKPKRKRGKYTDAD